MLVTDSGDVVGSVSGGCVEGALVQLGEQVLSDGIPRTEVFGISDDEAFAVGLSCGGILEIFIEKVDAATRREFDSLIENVRAHEPAAMATAISGDHIGRHLLVTREGMEGSFGSVRLDEAVFADGYGLLASGVSKVLRYGSDGERLEEDIEVFVTSFTPPPQMLILGAVDFSAALVRVGKLLGYRVAVCDARPAFATVKRFPEADAVHVAWPHSWLLEQSIDERTVIAVLTHDAKFDVPALEVALRSNAAYVGAMGSRRTHSDRIALLREVGVSEAMLARLHSPIGLDLGARTPEETAVSIAAEIVLARWDGSGAPLSNTSGPIHRDPRAGLTPDQLQ